MFLTLFSHAPTGGVVRALKYVKSVTRMTASHRMPGGMAQVAMGRVDDDEEEDEDEEGDDDDDIDDDSDFDASEGSLDMDDPDFSDDGTVSP